ncbi:MAG: hypothetical protein ICV60_13285 [Pyrinomonadaceae bacterium]|nr:hypothetical protein [Pyrinomonadaceae bacterium]
MKHINRPINFRVAALFAIICALAIGLGLPVVARGYGEFRARAVKITAVTNWQGQSSPSITFKATLVDPEKKAQRKEATVRVEVSGIELIDPAAVNEQPKAGQGHIHYQVDGGPVIATTATKLSFHGLTPGRHEIVVTLAGNDHRPLGPRETLSVMIP